METSMNLNAKRFQNCPKLQAAANNSDPLCVGKKGEAVEILQQALVDLGFDMPRSTKIGAMRTEFLEARPRKLCKIFNLSMG
jgi:hypothetical protein